MKRRILIVAPYNTATIGLCSLNLYKAFLQRKDCEVKCVCVHHFRNGYEGFEGTEYCVNSEAPVYLKWLNLFKQIKWLKRVKREYSPDITISTLSSCSTLNVLSGGNDRKIGVFHAPHYQEKVKGIIVYLNTLLSYRLVYPRLDRIVCVSEEVKKSILTAFREYKKKDVKVIYNVHDIENIQLKAKEPIPDGEKHIVTSNSIMFLGRLDKNKAPMRALKAFTEALENLPEDSNLLFIGKDADNSKQELMEYAKERGITNRVHILGFRSNPYIYLSRVKCLVSSSYSEGLPGVVIEALVLGTPVVTTNSTAGIWEIMSCYDKYDENLPDVFSCSDGFISSNMTIKHTEKESEDIKNLSVAFTKCLNSEKKVDFKFKNNIQGDKIVSQFLEP